LPELIVGHGALGRLLARIVVARGGSPTVWEKAPARRAGAEGYGYEVIDPDADDRRDYGCICDASGDPSIIDTLIMRLAKGGEIVLAGFYSKRVSFAFPMAFIKEAKLRIASEWAPNDMTSVLNLWTEGRLSLEGLITHRRPYSDAPDAYATAFSNPDCLKMVLDWSNAHD
jgi:3-hydroxyethyl bacteriochlorophyllide a dehydrogenase